MLGAKVSKNSKMSDDKKTLRNYNTDYGIVTVEITTDMATKEKTTRVLFKFGTSHVQEQQTTPRLLL